MRFAILGGDKDICEGRRLVEMSQIRYVLAAAKHLNFTKAAADCNVTQPALTKGIKTLETDLGAPVFHREGHKVLLSDFGRTMLPHLQNIMDEAVSAQELARNFRLLEKLSLIHISEPTRPTT